MRPRCVWILCNTAVVGCLLAQSTQPAASMRTDCDTSIYPLSSPTSRFEDGGDGTVTDTRSKLMWMRCAIGQRWVKGDCVGMSSALTWADAEQKANTVNKSGQFFYSDWRLPQLPELASISERQCKHPRINLDVFPNTVADFFWSATSRPRGAVSAPPGSSAGASSGPPEIPDQFAFVLSFGPDGVSYAKKQEQHNVRLVRSAR